MHDPASKVSMHGMLNSIISESIWGSLTLSNNNTNNNNNEEENSSNNSDINKILPVEAWKLYSTIPSRNPPGDNLITYGEFLETRTSLTRHERKALKTTFTEPGRVGEECREYYEKCLNCLCPTSPSSSPSSCYHILPSFFRLLLTLQEKSIDYRIIFRTFGTDTNNVVEEYNLFCRGEHPRFPHSMDMSKHTLPPHSIARLRRSHEDVVLQFQHHSQHEHEHEHQHEVSYII